MPGASEQSSFQYDSIPEREYYVAPRRKRRRKIVPPLPCPSGAAAVLQRLSARQSRCTSMPISDDEASFPVITLPQAEIDAGDTAEQSPELHSILDEESATEPKWNLILVSGEYPLRRISKSLNLPSCETYTRLTAGLIRHCKR